MKFSLFQTFLSSLTLSFAGGEGIACVGLGAAVKGVEFSLRADNGASPFLFGAGDGVVSSAVAARRLRRQRLLHVGLTFLLRYSPNEKSGISCRRSCLAFFNFRLFDSAVSNGSELFDFAAIVIVDSVLEVISLMAFLTSRFICRSKNPSESFPSSFLILAIFLVVEVAAKALPTKNKIKVPRKETKFDFDRTVRTVL